MATNEEERAWEVDALRRMARCALDRLDDPAPAPVPSLHRVLDDPLAGGSVPSEVVAAHTLARACAGMELPPRYVVQDRQQRDLLEWVLAADDGVLGLLLSRTPATVEACGLKGGFRLGLWQRFTAAWWSGPPVGAEVSLRIDADTVCDGCDGEARDRRTWFGASMCRHAGSVPEFTWNNIPPGVGARTWALLTMAGLLLSNATFSRLVAEQNGHGGGGGGGGGALRRGLMAKRVLRLVLVSCRPRLLGVFVRLSAQILAAFSRLSHGSEAPPPHYRLWVGDAGSMQAAAQLPADAAVVWLVSQDALLPLLREMPELCIAGCVLDGVPRERRDTPKSLCCKTMLLARDVQCLVQSTFGHASPVRHYWRRSAHRPATIPLLIRRREFSEAQQAVEDFCALSLVSLSHLNGLLHDDVASLHPRTLELHHVTSRGQSAGEAPADRLGTDIVPAGLTNGLLRHLPALDAFSVVVIVHAVHNVHTSQALARLLRTLCSDGASGGAVRRGEEIPEVARLVSRLEECEAECPICSGSDPRCPGLLPCCGHCVCATCYHRLTTCPFCRQRVPDAYHTSELPAPCGSWIHYPLRHAPSEAMRVDVARHATPARRLVENLTHVLCAAVNHGLRRVVVLVSRNADTYRGRLDLHVSAHELQRVTGIRVMDTDGLDECNLHALEDVFATDARAYPTPVALLACGDIVRAIEHMELGNADAVVFVGPVSAATIGVCLHRFVRPSPTPCVGARTLHLFRVAPWLRAPRRVLPW